MSDIFNIKRFGKYFLSDLKSAYSNFGCHRLPLLRTDHNVLKRHLVRY